MRHTCFPMIIPEMKVKFDISKSPNKSRDGFGTLVGYKLFL